MMATGTKNKRIIPAIISRIFKIGNKSPPKTKRGIPIMIAGTKKTTKPTEKDSTTPRRGKIMNNTKPTNSKGNNYFKQGFQSLSHLY